MDKPREVAWVIALLVAAPTLWPQELAPPVDALDLSSRIEKVYRQARERTVLVRGRVRGRNDISTSGTGAILTRGGIVVTCAHVIEDSVDLEVVFPDGRRHPARSLGLHPTADIALVKIRAGNLDPFPVRSHPPEIGEWIVALGHPGGAAFDLEPAPALGRIQRLGANLDETPSGRIYLDMIATDVPIFQGNSGGPLVDLYGNLVGINAAIRLDEDAAFAIPIARVLAAFPALRAGKTLDTPPRPGKPGIPGRFGRPRRSALAGLVRPIAASSRPWIVRILTDDRHLCLGVILGHEGRIVAPHFLVAPYRRVQVRFDDGETLEGTVGASDRRFGIVLVRVDADDLPTPVIAPFESLRRGQLLTSPGPHERVLGIGLLGSPHRQVRRERTERLLERLARFDLGRFSPARDFTSVLQHDTPLTIGELGGPLVDLRGRLVGINVSNSIRGAAYSAPAPELVAALPRLARGQEIAPPPRPFLGLDLRELTTEELTTHGLDGGLLVTEVLPGFCAEKAGLEPGDIVVRLGGVPIRVPEQLANLLSTLRPGHRTTIVVRRNSEPTPHPIVLDRAP